MAQFTQKSNDISISVSAGRTDILSQIASARQKYHDIDVGLISSKLERRITDQLIPEYNKQLAKIASELYIVGDLLDENTGWSAFSVQFKRDSNGWVVDAYAGGIKLNGISSVKPSNCDNPAKQDLEHCKWVLAVNQHVQKSDFDSDRRMSNWDLANCYIPAYIFETLTVSQDADKKIVIADDILKKLDMTEELKRIISRGYCDMRVYDNLQYISYAINRDFHRLKCLQSRWDQFLKSVFDFYTNKTKEIEDFFNLR